ncbi:MAG TPA: DUF4175 family protein, partial [Myxococcota bacterium]|nr:DUF4175 family protein [Myxococcota bacterium]
RAVLDGLVDWLGAELVSPFPTPWDRGAAALRAQEGIMERVAGAAEGLRELMGALRGDPLTKPEVLAAFANILEHVETAQTARGRLLVGAQKAPGQDASLGPALAGAQGDAVKQLEKDIVYLDDLLAVARIDELKATAKDLLSAQRDLQALLQQYRDTQDPALRSQLEARIGELRQKMLELLAKMGDIKKSLPGEYRNMEAGTMLRMDDQLARLEKQLKEGNLDAAAKELEQLANMVENMVSSINDAEEEYGGDRYKEVRQQLAEFAQQFKQLENEQQALSQRADDLLKTYRKNSIERAGASLDNFVAKARERTKKALDELDAIGKDAEIARQFDRDLYQARQSLLDLDALLSHRDFAEARQVAQGAEINNESLMSRLQGGPDRFPGLDGAELSKAARQSGRAVEHTRDIIAMLDKLFPDAQQVLSPEQMAQMNRMGKKQQTLQQEAKALEDRMQQLAGELPLFGGEPRQSLEGARGEMEQAARDIEQGGLPGGASHGRRAVEQLGKLREALERASKGGSGRGLPLPLGMGGQPGRDGTQWGDANKEEVEIPRTEPGRAGPRFRQELMDAAKQKPPTHYEEAVRHYYEELIR